jgi:hypothetical protein
LIFYRWGGAKNEGILKVKSGKLNLQLLKKKKKKRIFVSKKIQNKSLKIGLINAYV